MTAMCNLQCKYIDIVFQYWVIEIKLTSVKFSSVHPWGVSGPPPATYSGQPTGPNGQPVRPMFPSAAGANGPVSSGAESFKPTFPAYSE